MNTCEKKNIFTLSYGKDSISQIILAHKLKIKIDFILSVDMMFDDETPAFLPEEYSSFKKIDEYISSLTKKEITHLKGKTFVQHFYRRFGEKAKHKGEIYGWPSLSHHSCVLIKRNIIRSFLKNLKNNYTLFLGICFDEEKRYNSLLKNQRSILFENKITQEDTFKTCQDLNLLTPSYSLFNKRNGCFFCPFQPIAKFKYLIAHYPNLYKKMYNIGLDCSRPFHVWEKKHLLPLNEMKRKFNIF